MRPILRETRRIIIELDPELFLDSDLEVLDIIRQEEEKRNTKKVRALSEFSAMYRTNIYEIMKDFIIKFRNRISTIELKDFIVDHLNESIDALNVLRHITNPDQKNLDKTYLFRLVKFIEEIIFPRGSSIKIIYEKLLNKSKDYYESQRHVLLPHTFYRDKLKNPDYIIIPGMSPKVYQIINNITSLYNLDPNYGSFPEKPDYEIPMLLINEVFEPYTQSIL